MNKKKKFDKYAKRRLIAVLLIIIIILLIIISNKKTKKYINYRVIIGDKYIELKDGLYVDGVNNIYMTKEDISNLYDPNLYYDSSDERLVTTYNKHIAILNLDDPIININGSNIEIGATMQKINDKIYIPFSELGIVYDFEYLYAENTKTLIIDSISEEKKEADVIKKHAKLKNKNSIFSKTIEKINFGDKVFIIDEQNNYYKVRTNNGNFGYVKKKKLGNVNNIREKMDETKLYSLKFIEYKADYSSMQINTNETNAIVVSEVNIKNSTINKKDIIKIDEKFSDWAEQNNILLVSTITNSDDISQTLLKYNDRNTLINSLYDTIVLNNIKAVNIDFNNINDFNSFYRFLIELAPKFRESGIKVMVQYKELLNEEKLNSIVDYVVK